MSLVKIDLCFEFELAVTTCQNANVKAHVFSLVCGYPLDRGLTQWEQLLLTHMRGLLLRPYLNLLRTVAGYHLGVCEKFLSRSLSGI